MESNTMKIKIALLFGGKSAEHDISIISAIQAKNNLNPDKYEVFPVYITKTNEMYCGPLTGVIEEYRDTDGLIKASSRVSLVRRGERVYLTKLSPKLFEKRDISEIDVLFPVVHGTNTEDGTLQGYCQMLDLPYVGCDVLSSALGMDKYLTKVVLKEAGIPVLDGVRASLVDYNENAFAVADRIESAVGYPAIIKPINCGSSIGISKAKDREALENALALAFNYSENIIAERAIEKLREINCSVIGDASYAKASECEEPVGSDEILSFSDKYTSGGKSQKGGAKTSEGMASLKRRIPAPIDADTREYIRNMAVKAFRALGCSGVSRIDFMIDGEDGKVYFNEINTIPGSLSFYLWEPLGLKYPDMLDEIIRIALSSRRRREKLTFTFSSSVLSGASFSGSKGSKR